MEMADLTVSGFVFSFFSFFFYQSIWSPPPFYPRAPCEIPQTYFPCQSGNLVSVVLPRVKMQLVGCWAAGLFIYLVFFICWLQNNSLIVAALLLYQIADIYEAPVHVTENI